MVEASTFFTSYQPAASTTNRNAAVAAGIFSELAGAYANFAAVRSQQMQLRSEASAQAHHANMLAFDRRAAERRAQQILQEGQDQAAMLGLEGGQRRGALRARAAARGVTGQSAREAELSDQLIQDLDIYHVNLAAVRAANAARREATEIDNRALFARTSAQNLRSSARAAQPEAQLIGGLSSAVTRGVGTYKKANY